MPPFATLSLCRSFAIKRKFSATHDNKSQHNRTIDCPSSAQLNSTQLDRRGQGGEQHVVQSNPDNIHHHWLCTRSALSQYIPSNPPPIPHPNEDDDGIQFNWPPFLVAEIIESSGGWTSSGTVHTTIIQCTICLFYWLPQWMNDERRINGSIRWRAINSLSIPRDRSIPPQQKSQTLLGTTWDTLHYSGHITMAIAFLLYSTRLLLLGAQLLLLWWIWMDGLRNDDGRWWSTVLWTVVVPGQTRPGQCEDGR